MKIISRFLLVFLLPVIMSSLAVAQDILAETSSCKDVLGSIEEKFYTELIALDASRNDVDVALKLLENAEKKCKLDQDQLAMFYDLKGEASHVAYKITGNKRYFEHSLAQYNKALSVNSSRNEKVYWHIARLMRSAKNYGAAVEYINKVLDIDPMPKDPTPYLGTALDIAVAMESWGDAKGLVEVLSSRNKRYYAEPMMLLRTIETLCHFRQFDDASKIISNVETYVEYDYQSKMILNESKSVLERCRK